jgi:hypothetical protein
VLGNLLTNFMARPHFISYGLGPRPLPVKLCRLMKPMNFVWTVRPGSDMESVMKENDTVIFEYFRPQTRFK